MNKHGSLNRIYRIVWNKAKGMLVAVSELTKGQGKGGSGQCKLSLKGLVLLVPFSLLSLSAQASPTGGLVTSGTGTISQSGTTTTITQGSQNLSLNWNTYNIAGNETVNYQQPNSSAIAVNRILDTNGSQIFGHINANGQIYLINPNGILFGNGAQVNVGGLVASTLNINDASIGTGSQTFSGTGTGSIVNKGNLTAANGGYVALLANKVSNSGSINATLGTVAMGAGNQVTLNFNGNSLVSLTVDQSTLNNLAANHGLIQANGGVVVMNAGAKDAILASVVNNDGIIEAQTVQNQNGKITLLGSMAAGTTKVSGTLDASAPAGGSLQSSGAPTGVPLAGATTGNGGFIETSAHNVKIADGTSITTKSAAGSNGTWLIDPTDFTIAATGGDMTGATLSTNLGAGNVTIASTSGAAGTAGDINVNDQVSWSANTLTLNAQNNININHQMNATGTAGLRLVYGQANVAAGNASTYNVNAPVNLASTSIFKTRLGSDGTVINYTIIDSLGAAGSTTGTDLQGINGGLSGNYVLGANIDATGTSTWNSNAGFTPIGSSSTSKFTGTFNGLGHTISNLTINLTSNNVGLFGYVGAAGTISNVGMVGVSVSGTYNVGGLVGVNSGTISNSYASGSVNGAGSIGGLVGANSGTISNSYVTNGNVSVGSGNAGGLVGVSTGTISNSYATNGSVSASSFVGGLVGANYGGTISNSYATNDSVGGTWTAGGLVGYNAGTISNSYVSGGTVSGMNYIGGFVGANWGTNGTLATAGTTANISTSYVDGVTVNGTGNDVGGFVGLNQGGNGGNATSVMTAAAGGSATVSNSYVNGGTVSGASNVGGFVGLNQGGNGGAGASSNISALTGGAGGNGGAATISTSYASGGLVSGSGSNIAGLIGNNASGAYGTAGGGANGGAGGTGGTASAVNTLWDADTTGQASAIGAGNMDSVTQLNSSTPTVNAFTQSTYTGFDFTSGTGNWYMVDGYTRPFLQMEASTSITNAHQLQLIGMNTTTLAENYTLEANLDLTNTSATTGMWNGTFVPIGDSTNQFSGSFDGQNHTISNLTINLSRNDVGLFGVTNGATISNVGLVNSTIIAGSGTSNVGVLAGVTSGGTSISNSYASGGSVTGGGYEVGGLVGLLQNGDIISGSYASVSVTASSTSVNVGGLVGNTTSTSTISNSYASGNVSGAGYVGGMVGLANGTISGSHATGNVSGTGNDVGGLVGYNTGTINSGSYATGSVSGNNAVGGLVGNNTGTIDSLSHATGNVTATGNSAGGLVGWNNGGTISNSYVSGGTVSGTIYVGGMAGCNSGTINYGSYATNSSVSGNSSVGGLVGLNTGAISSSHATGTVSGSSLVGGLVGTDTGTISGSHAGGIVSGTGNKIGGLVGYGNYSSISNSYVSGGSVNGNNYVGGLVGSNYGSSISNSYASVSVSGNSGVGGLIGSSYGAISNSYATGNVTGTANNTGGLVGYLYGGTVSNSYAIGNVSGTNSVGGLVGKNTGTIDSLSHATGNVTGIGSVGGLVGLNYGGTISNSYATGGSVSATTGGYVGGLVGYNRAGTISNSYVSGGSVSGISNVGGLVGGNAGGAGVSGTPIAGSAAIISNSYVNGGTVSGTGNNVGGFVGLNKGGNGGASSTVAFTAGGAGGAASISSSYVNGGTVSGTGSNVGGFAGLNQVGAKGSGSLGGAGGAASIDNSYTTGSVSGGSYVGGLLGFNNGGSVTSNYWNNSVNTGASGVWYGIGYDSGVGSGSDTGAGGLTSAQMMQMSSFAGFNIANTGSAGTTWRIYDGYTTPMLTSFLTPLTVSVGGNKVYDGQVGSLSYSATPDMNNILGTPTFSGGTVTADVGTYNNVTVSGGLYSGQQGYDISYDTTPASFTISQLSSVAWVGGGATTNWSDAGNWAGGATPTLSNVANVTIGNGYTVTYDGGTTNLTKLTSSGDFIMSAGNLSTTGNFNTAGYTQTGGTLNVGGILKINSLAGITMGNIVASTLNATSTGGNINQLTGSGLIVTGNSNLTANDGVGTLYNINLSNTGNNFKGVVNADGQIIKLADKAGGLTFGNISAGSNLIATSQTGNINSAAGKAIIVNGITTLTADNGSGTLYNINLSNSGNNFKGVVNADGQIIKLVNKAGGLTFGNISAGSNLVATNTGGNINQLAGSRLIVTGNSSLTANDGVGNLYNINLSNSGNNFKGVVNADGQIIKLADVNALSAMVTASSNTVLASGGTLTLGGNVGGNLTTGAAKKTLFNNTSVGHKLDVTSGNIVQRTSSNTTVTVNGVDVTTTSSPDVTVNGTSGALIP